jgi:hypothetical protein
MSSQLRVVLDSVLGGNIELVQHIVKSYIVNP